MKNIQKKKKRGRPRKEKSKFIEVPKAREKRLKKEAFVPQDGAYWASRPLDDEKRDWVEESIHWIEGYWDSRHHPHRTKLMDVLEKFQPIDGLLELGCNAGANLATLRSRIPDNKLAGIDINAAVIAYAKEQLPAIDYRIGSITKLPWPDKSFDAVLTDATLIYVGPKEINVVLDEIERITRKCGVLLEWFDENKKGVIKDYHWARNYPLLLKKRGFEVETTVITEAIWPNTNWIKHGRIFAFRRPLPTGEKS